MEGDGSDLVNQHQCEMGFYLPRDDTHAAAQRPMGSQCQKVFRAMIAAAAGSSGFVSSTLMMHWETDTDVR